MLNRIFTNHGDVAGMKSADAVDAPAGEWVPGARPASVRAGTGVVAETGRCLNRAVEFALGRQAGDGAWYVPSEPRTLENAVVACSLAGLEQVRPARERAVRWLEGASPQRHNAFVFAADQWLAGLHRTDGLTAFTAGASQGGPQARRALYLGALGYAVGATGSDALRLLDQARAALGPDRGRRLKPWQRAMLLAFEAFAGVAMGVPLARHTLQEWEQAQSPDGAFYGMPLVTGMLHLALTRTAPDHPVTRRCRDGLLAAQQPDGTWRFLVSEVWDTGLMVRGLRGHPRFDSAVLPAALDFLVSARKPDGGWACTAPLASDNDTTGNTLLALAGTDRATDPVLIAAAARYALSRRTPEGLWTTWHSSDASRLIMPHERSCTG